MRVCEWARTHVSAWCGHGMGEGRGVGQATRWVRGKGGGPGDCAGLATTPHFFPCPLRDTEIRRGTVPCVHVWSDRAWCMGIREGLRGGETRSLGHHGGSHSLTAHNTNRFELRQRFRQRISGLFVWGPWFNCAAREQNNGRRQPPIATIDIPMHSTAVYV